MNEKSLNNVILYLILVNLFLISSLQVTAKTPSNQITKNIIDNRQNVLFRDKAIYSINHKTYFLSELNQLLNALKSLKCFKTNALIKYLGFSKKKLNSLKMLTLQDLQLKSSSKVIELLISLTKLEQFALGKDVFETIKSYSKGRRCNYKLTDGLKRVLFLEMYLSDRFSNLDKSSVKSFKETMVSMISAKLYE